MINNAKETCTFNIQTVKRHAAFHYGSMKMKITDETW